MPLRVITGSANTGKAGVAYARLREVVQAGAAGIVLLPGSPDVSRVARELAHFAPLGMRAATFNSYLDGLWSARGDGRQLVDASQRQALLADIVNTMPGDALSSVRASPGLPVALGELVQRAAESLSIHKAGAGSSRVGAELVTIVMHYFQRLEQHHLVERAAAHQAVAALVGELTLPDIMIVNGFTDMTTAQEAFVTAASARSEVIVCLTYDDAVPATSAAAGLVSRLTSLGSQEHLTEGGEYSSSSEIRALERHFGGTSADGFERDGSIIFSEAWGGAMEGARIAAEVQNALSAGIRAERIAIAFDRPGEHLDDLRRALEEIGVPADYDARVPFGQTGLGRALLALLGYLGAGWTVASLTDVLKSPYAPGTDEALDELDARVRVRRDVSRRALEALCRETDPGVGDFIARAYRACEKLGSDAAHSQWYPLVTGMYARAHPREGEIDIATRLDSAAHETFFGALSSLALLETGPVTPERLARILGAVHVAVSSSEHAGHVQVMSVERLRGRRFECVIIGGLAGDDFPGVPREEAVSSPAIARTLAAAGIDTARRDTLEDDRLLFYQAATRASRRLVLSWQSYDAEGLRRRPPVFVEEVLDLFRDASGAFIGEPPPWRTLSLEGLALVSDGPTSERRRLRTAAATRPSPGEDGRLTHARHRARGRSAALGERALKALAARDVVGATEIECYLSCPYRWFIEYVVRPSSLDATLDAAAHGTVAHQVMRRFYERFTGLGQARVTPENLQEALAVHAEVGAEVVTGIAAIGLGEELALRATVRKTARIVKADATFLPGFSPAHHELAFGRDGDAGEDLGGFRLAGRIDRVDVDGEHLVIVDYKSRKLSAKDGCNAFAEAGHVQLPLYAHVASRRLSKRPVGAVYRGLSEDKPRGLVGPHIACDSFVRTDVVDEGEFDTVIEDALERARAAVEGMRAGVIPPEPLGGECASYCGAQALCPRKRAHDG